MTATSSPASGSPDPSRLPVAVIGAGPIGLVAALHLATKGETPLVLEAGDAVGASIREWAHVRLFSPWKYLVDPVAKAALEARGWTAPEAERLPTGGELVSRLLEPLAALPNVAPHLRFGHRVLAVTRAGIDKVKSDGRAAKPFQLTVGLPDGTVTRFEARAVIDGSGTWTAPNPLGAAGVPVPGEAAHADRIHVGIPDVLGAARDRYAGRRILVVGSGHSAFNALLDLAALAAKEPGTVVVWAIRRAELGQLFGGGSQDQLEARGELGTRLRALVARGQIRMVTGFGVDRLDAGPNGRLIIGSTDGRKLEDIDRIVVATGFRPNLAITRELRLRLDPWLEAPERLAPLIDPNVHSCGTVYPHGAAELAHPEVDYYVVGMKSYGRAPTFLLLTGYEQVRSVVCALTGDEEGARRVELVLPETGVCNTDLSAGSCCGAEGEAASTFAGSGDEPLDDQAPVPVEGGASAVAVSGRPAVGLTTSGGCGCGTAPGSGPNPTCCH